MELVIVIAVIAVLAAVLIPTFANVTERANTSADTQTVKNLNTILMSEETLGNKPATMAEALAVAESGGYKVENLTPTGDGNHIVWLKERNRFALLNENKELIYSDSSVTTLEGLTVYKMSNTLDDLNSDDFFAYCFTSETKVENGVVEVSDSADFSLVEGITSITVNNDSAMEITAEGEDIAVTVTGTDTLGIYGTVGSISGKDYGKESLHIYGTVTGKIEIAKGRVVAEAGSVINSIIVTANSTGEVEINNQNGSDIKSVGAIVEDVAKNLGEVVSNTNSIDIVSTPISNDFAGGVGTETSPYLIANAEQFGKIADFYPELTAEYAKNIYFMQIDDIYISHTISYFAGNYDGGGYKLGLDESVVTLSGTALFCYIFGTEDYDIAISNIRLVQGESRGLAITANPQDDLLPSSLIFENIEVISGDGKPVKVNAQRGNFGFLSIGVIYNYSGHPVSLIARDIVINSDLQSESTCSALLFGQGIANADGYGFDLLSVTFENCVNEANLVGTSVVGYFTGNYGTMLNPELITVKNCVNNGAITSCANGTVGAFASNDILNNKYERELGGTFASFNDLENIEYSVYQNGSEFTIQTSDSSYQYMVGLSVSALYYGDIGSQDVENGRKYMFDLSIITDTTALVSVTDISYHAYDYDTAIAKGVIDETTQIEYVILNSKSVGLYVSGNNTYLIFEESDEYAVDSSIELYVYAYKNNQLVGFEKIK